jgi:hypothetical protein
VMQDRLNTVEFSESARNGRKFDMDPYFRMASVLILEAQARCRVQDSQNCPLFQPKGKKEASSLGGRTITEIPP